MATWGNVVGSVAPPPKASSNRRLGHFRSIECLWSKIGAVELQRLGADEWPLWPAVRLDALREAPDAFDSSLSDWQGDGDVEERWRARRNDVPFNIGGFVHDRPAGQASGPMITGQVGEPRVLRSASQIPCPFDQLDGALRAALDMVVREHKGRQAL